MRKEEIQIGDKVYFFVEKKGFRRPRLRRGTVKTIHREVIETENGEHEADNSPSYGIAYVVDRGPTFRTKTKRTRRVAREIYRTPKEFLHHQLNPSDYRRVKNSEPGELMTPKKTEHA